MKEKIIKCLCGEKFDTDGWNIKEKTRQGNHYRYKKEGNFSIKYTKCNKCDREIILRMEEFLK